MKRVRIIIDKSKCSAMGMCVLRAPETFDQSVEDGKAYVKQGAVVGDNIEAVREAVFDCPSQALSLVEKEAVGD